MPESNNRPYTVIEDGLLDDRGSVREFVGKRNGAPVCVILVDMGPGESVRLHRHAYPEVFILEEGSATFRIGSETLVVEAPRTMIVEAGVAHGFTNTGPGRLRQVDVHLSPEFRTEWLE
jgi:mannose-6-phosphate isomerase-like protein (cupin superfamily)